MKPWAMTSVELDPSAVDRVVFQGYARQGVAQAAQRGVSLARSNIRQLGRIDTGAMYRSITWQSEGTREHPTARIFSKLRYTGYQEEGTKAHGPVKAKFMVFTPKGSNQVVFAKWVRGIKPGRFMRNSLNGIRPSDFM